jgi:hypothetical protein
MRHSLRFMDAFARNVVAVTVRPDSGEAFWVVDAGWAGPAEQAEVYGRAAVAYRCELAVRTVSLRVVVAVWPEAPPGETRGDRPFYSPSGAISLEASGVRAGDRVRLDGPGLYWVTTRPTSPSGGGASARGEEVRIWRVAGQTPPNTPLFPREQPQAVAEFTLAASHGEFWVHNGQMWRAGEPPLIPEGGIPQARGGAMAVPTLVYDTDVGVVLSLWDREPPAAAGQLLGECRLRVSEAERELRISSVADVSDAVFALPGEGEYAVSVWRRLEPGETFEYERYDLRVRRCPGT